MRNVTLDQFFTRKEDAQRLITILNDQYPLESYDFVLEPSAGAGAFYQFLPQHNRIGLDIMPLFDGVEKVDFFEWKPPTGKIAVIGNPPFGRRGSIARKFLKQSFKFADVVAFILPAIFSKPSFYQKMDSHFHLVHETPVSCFELPNGSEYKVNCIFQIWKKCVSIREHEKLDNHHEDFQMIHRHIAWTEASEIRKLADEYDFAFGQVSQKISNINELKSGSQFLILDVSHHGSVRDVFERMNFTYLKKYAMGAISLSRSDIIREYKRLRSVTNFAK